MVRSSFGMLGREGTGAGAPVVIGVLVTIVTTVVVTIGALVVCKGVELSFFDISFGKFR